MSKAPLRASAAIALLAFGFGCQGQSETAAALLPGDALDDAAPPLLSRTRPLMSTVFQIRVDSAPGNAENVIRQAFEEVERLENVLSEWRDDSDISKVNKLAGRKAVKDCPSGMHLPIRREKS